ncbi:MAG: enoyl-CoA hydratase/isomerase family protein, partial [Dehalococcoidia bacterium]
MEYEGLILEKGEGVATITLNKPDKLNAISLEMTKDLLTVLEDISRDRAIRVWVLTGAGRGFCSGADLSE